MNIFEGDHIRMYIQVILGQLDQQVTLALLVLLVRLETLEIQVNMRLVLIDVCTQMCNYDCYTSKMYNLYQSDNIMVIESWTFLYLARLSIAF